MPGVPWDVLLPTGSGTFEGYVGWGAGCGASADGRRSGSPIASDFGAATTPLDKPSIPKSFDIYKSVFKKSIHSHTRTQKFDKDDILYKNWFSCGPSDKKHLGLCLFLNKWYCISAFFSFNSAFEECLLVDPFTHALNIPSTALISAWSCSAYKF